jgi:nitrogen fixation protein NifZ
MTSRDSDVVEINNPPAFLYGELVRAKRHIRNDGTFPGREIGEILVRKGDLGYVTSIGTFLQQFYIYGVDFYTRGNLVGMKARELERVETGTEEADPVTVEQGAQDETPLSCTTGEQT